MSGRLPFLPPCPSTSPRRGSRSSNTSPEPQSEQPSEPNYFAEVYKWPGVWNLCKDCWNFDPKRRPTMGTVVRRLGEIRRKGPYDDKIRMSPHIPDLHGPKRALSPALEDHEARKSPRLSGRELPDTGRGQTILRTSYSPTSSSEARARTPRTPTMRTTTLHPHEEFVRKPRSSRLSFTSTSGSSSSVSGPASTSSSGYSSPRVHPYHTSIFKSNRPQHRRSPPSGTDTPVGAITSSSAPASLAPSREPSEIHNASYNREAPLHSPAGLELTGFAPLVPQMHNGNPLQPFPQQLRDSYLYSYGSRHLQGNGFPDTPYREGDQSLRRSDQAQSYFPRRHLTQPPESSSILHPSSSHHMTSQLFVSNHHHHHLSPTPSRQYSSASSHSDSLPHSPSPSIAAIEPRIVDAQDGMPAIGANYYNPGPSFETGPAYPQPYALDPEGGDISAQDYAAIEKEWLNLSQSSSPNHSPTRTPAYAQIGNNNTATMRNTTHSNYIKSLQRKVSNTLELRPEFLTKYKDLDEMLAQSPSPTESGFTFPTPRGEAPPSLPSDSRSNGFFAARHLQGIEGYNPAPPPRGSMSPRTQSRSGSLLGVQRPQFAEEWTESPGMRGRSLLPDDTPSLRPTLTLLSSEGSFEDISPYCILNEEALEFEEDVDDAPPPDSMMSHVSHDFDEETDVEFEGEDDDLLNAVLPLGYSGSDEPVSTPALGGLQDSFSSSDGVIEDGVGLFGGRYEDQYWRHEENGHLGNGNGFPGHGGAYSGGSTPTLTPRQAPMELPMGLGIKIHT